MLAYLKRIGGRLVEEATRKKTASATSENIVVSEDNPAVSEDDPAMSEDDPAMSEDDPARPDIISAPSAPATQSMASRPVRDRLLEIQALGLGVLFWDVSLELVVKRRQGRIMQKIRKNMI